MLIFGAFNFAAALSKAARFLGCRVSVCDARPVFATRARFPHTDEVVVDWPTAISQPRGRRPHRDLRPHPRRQVRHPPLPQRLTYVHAKKTPASVPHGSNPAWCFVPASQGRGLRGATAAPHSISSS